MGEFLLSKSHAGSGNVVPDGGVAGDQQRIFARVPTQEMRSAGVRGVVFAAGPDFMEQVGAGVLEAAVQVVLQAPLFFASGSDEGTKLSFEKQLLALLGAQYDDQRYGFFGEFDRFCATQTATRTPSGGLATFGLGHVGGIVLQTH